VLAVVVLAGVVLAGVVQRVCAGRRAVEAGRDVVELDAALVPEDVEAVDAQEAVEEFLDP